MANYKLDIRKQYGQFQHRVYKHDDNPPEHTGKDNSVQEMLSSVMKSLETAGVKKGDTVRFRNIAYDNHDMLFEMVRTAPY